ncbi:Glycerol-1-phosphate phosphohydrolase 2 [Penicillium argentinense]|uniref:Glycerol-1-phosphate phosphohydrolase 2 n=1 Tax=Penicillium argentinense TaxID=1131581 RepID=A0A9W9FF73_9EURO|nr:Glycerol-1-phosphate phosphohydrolase 2 [Penicillium argentinense]KAJ5098857.1 Glycerol-1-phosphate phosphohydrolase 2 [Penicillium argentinense]
MSTTATQSFSAPTETVTFDGILSDFDGTIVDSTNAIVKHWHKIGAELGVDPEVILATSHGRRSIDTMALYDKNKANWEYVNYIEGRIPKEYGSDAKEIPGGRDMLSALETSGAKWGVVTSGTRALIDGWLEVLGLTHPDKLVVAEDVELGKPDPRCYLLGAKRIGLEDSKSIVVLEDAPSGIKAGKAAGYKVLALATTHALEKLREAGADWIVEDLRSVSVKGVVDGKVQIEICNALQ